MASRADSNRPRDYHQVVITLSKTGKGLDKKHIGFHAAVPESEVTLPCLRNEVKSCCVSSLYLFSPHTVQISEPLPLEQRAARPARERKNVTPRVCLPPPCCSINFLSFLISSPFPSKFSPMTLLTEKGPLHAAVTTPSRFPAFFFLVCSREFRPRRSPWPRRPPSNTATDAWRNCKRKWHTRPPR